VANCHRSEKGKTRDKVAAVLGISGRQWDKLKDIEESGYADLKEELERHGKVDRVYRKLQRRGAVEAIASENLGKESQKVICADCRNVLPTFADETFDAVPTDPPFGINFEYDDGQEPCDNPEDYWKWFGPIFQEIWRVTKPGGFVCLWQANKYLDYFTQWYGKWHLFVACKKNVKPCIPYTDSVDILVVIWKPGSKPRLPPVQECSRNYFESTIQYGDELSSLHPCPRPLDLCEHLIRNFTPEYGLILDCFAGAGTIPLAVQRVGGGRHYVAIEQNPRYCQVAEERLKRDETGKTEVAGM
jgi:DNA modification methylase